MFALKAVQDELLYRRLGWEPTDFSEAPLAYDSVLAITQGDLYPCFFELLAPFVFTDR